MTLKPDYDRAVAYAIDQLRSNLDPRLTYHDLWHTQNDVLPAVLRLAAASEVDEEDMELLRVAAAFHDVGFISTIEGHEIIGARMVAQVLPEFGFSNWQIERIMGMILATRLPQSPRNFLEEIMADADLDVLGRDDFPVRNQRLRREMANYGQPMTDEEWLHFQLDFLQGHTYFTSVAKSTRAARKLAHFAAIQVDLTQMVG